MPQTNEWTIELKRFNAGFAPLAFTDSLTEIGGSGHAAIMTDSEILDGRLVQGPGLTNLTNGTQAGVVLELIQFIMDRAVSDNVTYAIGTAKLFKLSATAVTSDATWPHTITNCTDGQSIQVLKGNLYYFFNKASGGDIGKYNLDATFTDNWGSTVPTGASALQKAIHPSDKKEDILLFGNGRYVGTYITATNTLSLTKLDFGNDAVVADVLYHAGYWYIAVNSGVSGNNRTEGQVYLYDGSAVPSTLDDETAVGMQRIGFLYRINGVIYIAYQDLSSSGFIIGYIAGKSIKALARFTGTLPNFQQKTLYKNTILFLSSALIYSAGALVEDLPFQLSQIADGGYATVGGLAAPFGTPMVASTDGATNFRIAKFSGFSTNTVWKSIVFTLVGGLNLGYIDSITVLTNSLVGSARLDLTIEANQAANTSNTMQITGTGNTRHYFTNTGLASIQDFRVALSGANADTTNSVYIRKIIIKGHYVGG